jgi:alpha-maltose-1-phosphate synthase
MATAAIWYESDGYRLEGRPLMGRRVAGQEFLKAFARFARTDRFTAVVRNRQNQAEFVATMRELRPKIPAIAVTPDAMGEIADVGCLYYRDPFRMSSPGCGATLRPAPGACAASLTRCHRCAA